MNAVPGHDRPFRFPGLQGVLPITPAQIPAEIAAGCLLLARVTRLGFMADFLSRTVLIGFLTGVGIQVAIGQLTGMLGVQGGGHGTVGKTWNDLRQMEQVTLRSLHAILQAQGIRLIAAHVLDELATDGPFGLRRLLGEHAFYDTLEDVRKDFLGQAEAADASVPGGDRQSPRFRTTEPR